MAIRPGFSLVPANRPDRRLRRAVLGLLGAWLLSGLLGGPAAGSAGAGSPAAKAWRVSTDPTFPPFEYRDNGSSRITGFSPLERMRFVVAPQAIGRVLPPLANELITLIKDTSLAAVIGFDELFRQGQLMVATTYRAFEIYIAVALVYLVMTTSASQLFKWLERRLRLPA